MSPRVASTRPSMPTIWIEGGRLGISSDWIGGRCAPTHRPRRRQRRSQPTARAPRPSKNSRLTPLPKPPELRALLDVRDLRGLSPPPLIGSARFGACFGAFLRPVIAAAGHAIIRREAQIG